MALGDDRLVITRATDGTRWPVVQGNDVQLAIPDERILILMDIALVLIIATAPAIYLVIPPSGVDGIAVKFIGPYQAPLSRHTDI